MYKVNTYVKINEIIIMNIDMVEGKIHTWKCTAEINIYKNKLHYNYEHMWEMVKGKIHTCKGAYKINISK